MKLGFLTACMPERSLEQIARWAAKAGFEALEVAAWPALGNRPFTVSHLPLPGPDGGALDGDDAERIRVLFADHGLAISSLAFYDNNLHPDQAERMRIHEHLHACIDAAAALGVPTVGTFVGRHPGRTVAENLRDAERVFAAG